MKPYLQRPCRCASSAVSTCSHQSETRTDTTTWFILLSSATSSVMHYRRGVLRRKLRLALVLHLSANLLVNGLAIAVPLRAVVQCFHRAINLPSIRRRRATHWPEVAQKRSITNITSVWVLALYCGMCCVHFCLFNNSSSILYIWKVLLTVPVF